MDVILLEKYGSYFHDGILLNIDRLQNDCVDLVVESMEITPNENIDQLTLSAQNTLCGAIHLKNIKEILINGEKKHEIKMLLPEGLIMHLSTTSHSFNIEILWYNPNASQGSISNYENIEITCDHVDWEFVNNANQKQRT